MTDPLVAALDAISAKQAALCLEYETAGLATHPAQRREALVWQYATLEETAATLRALLPPSPPPPAPIVIAPSRRSAFPPAPRRTGRVTPSVAWWGTASRDHFTADAARRTS